MVENGASINFMVGTSKRVKQIPRQRKKKFNQPGKVKKKGFFKKKKHVSKLKCYNCGKKGHFSCDYKEPRKVNDLSVVVCTIHVSSFVFLTESYPSWTVDSRATEHVAKDKSAFVEFQRIPQGKKWIYVGNNSKAEVTGIGTCKLVMENGQPYSYTTCYLLLISIGI